MLLPTDTEDEEERVDAFVAVITSLAARLSGRRNGMRQAAGGAAPGMRSAVCGAGGSHGNTGSIGSHSSRMSTVQRAYRVEVDQSNHQLTACRTHAGAAAYGRGCCGLKPCYVKTLVERGALAVGCGLPCNCPR